MEATKRGDVAIGYDRVGPEDAETIVFLERLGYSRWMWNWQRQDFEDSYELLVPDNRGTGTSSEPDGPYTIAEMAADLDAVLADAGADTAHLVGAEMGGMIALQYALAYDRADSLTLMATHPGGPDATPTPESVREQLFDAPEGLDERERIRRRLRPAFSDAYRERYPDVVDQIAEWRAQSDASEQARAWQAAAVDAFDVSDRLGEIELPVLVMSPTGDRIVPPENGELLADRLPNADLLTFRNAPHLFFIEEAIQVNEHLAVFLEDVRT
ncbi:alpha/beta fold hydrolase [Halapricum hydrolyticum]|uniref:Alpha/beta hydrolase n=1 Tax=Halapricum hydrolyticum TaxID=2979991 RepID=A0AAE3IAD1_9EURY|nr:alpha/beta hydrolase [Halapricum hydrolyticum]MCU4717082.1 alpha/beta hydrolase [Halapricum hydrolyticum]MCU4726009.1 alpha/beta hydrolase [Halapricum hydrolyticum]